MKFSLLLLFFLVTVCMIEKSDCARRRRFRDRVKPLICKVVCNLSCRRLCPFCKPVCGTACHKVCNGKRSKVGSFLIKWRISCSFFFILPPLIFRWKISENPPLPCDFTMWDKNNDGHVDMVEFSSVGYPTIKEDDLALAFQATDTDGIFTKYQLT